MKQVYIVLTALLLVFSFNGCTGTKVEYIKQPPFTFYKVMKDIKGKLEVDAKTKEVQKICTPLVVEATDKVWLLVEYHEDQITRYEEYVDINNSK